VTNVKVQRKDVPSDTEIEKEIANADKIKDTYLKLRAKATIALLETGKRRSELASLKVSDIWTDDKFLYVRFTVVKKRKKNIITLQRIKKFDLTSKYATIILEYLNYLKREYPNCEFMYPSGRMVFGNYFVDQTKALKSQEIWRIIKALNPKDWPHLHRERRAVKRIRADEKKYGEAKIETVYAVKRILDLERESTAWNYIRRHETQRAEEQEEIEG
jgi:integrase